MSDLELLFLVLAVLYAWECACWLPRGSVAFVTWLGRRWRPVHPGMLLGNQHGSFIFAPPLPPLGTVLTGNQFPLSLTPDAVLSCVAPGVNPGGRPQQTGRLFRLDEIKTIAANGRKVLVNGELLVRATSPHFAHTIAGQLRQVQKLPTAERARRIETLAREAFDADAIERRWHELKKHGAGIRWAANALFLHLFLASPAVIWECGLAHSWPGLLIGVFALTTATAIGFRRAHLALYPEAEDERFTHFLTILLAPVTTIRAHDVLSRPLLEPFHPLAVAKVFCSPDAFREFARQLLLDIRFPALPAFPADVPGAETAERDSRALLQKTAETFLRQNKIDPDELAKPPAPLDETCRAFCPRCRAQFTSSGGFCSDCGGLPLRSFRP